MSIAIGELWCSLGSRVVPDVIRAFAGGDGGEEFEDMTPRGQPRGIHQDHSGASGLACGSWCGWWVEKHS